MTEPAQPSAVVFGGYGTFGSHVSRELARLGVPVVVAGRSADKARDFAASLPVSIDASVPHRGIVADAGDPASCRAELRVGDVAVSCAGPFSALGRSLLDACIDVGCDYADIADDRAYVAAVWARSDELRAHGCSAVIGCSSLPAISGALALQLLSSEAVASGAAARAGVERARVTLFVGNDNPKGLAAIRSAVAGLGRPIDAPQGRVHGFRDGEWVTLPSPFGRRRVYNFEAPEYDLFPALLGARAVSVKVGFELWLATRAFATLAALGSGYGDGTARLLSTLGGLGGTFGCSGGAVMTELFLADGRVLSASLSGPTDGQRMAALPCAFVAAALLQGEGRGRGACTAYELLGADALLAALGQAGFALSTQVPRS